jgi:hypothetical protein
MEMFADRFDQNDWSGKMQFLVYILSFMSVIFISEMYISDWIIAAIMGSIWIPQIYRNTVKGCRNMPSSMTYAVCTSVHLLLVPVYFKGINDNFLAMKPHFYFVMLLGLYVFT